MIFTIQSNAKVRNVTSVAPRRVSVLPLHVWRIQSVTSFVLIQTSPIIMASAYKLDSEYQRFYLVISFMQIYYTILYVDL